VLIFSIALLAIHSLIRNEERTKSQTLSVLVVMSVLRFAKFLLALASWRYVFSESFIFAGGSKAKSFAGFFGFGMDYGFIL
jgi:hypothetical protein